MFIRRGVLMVAQFWEEKINLVPLFAPTATPQLEIEDFEGAVWGHCYDPVEDELYILDNEGSFFLLRVHSLTEGVHPRTRTITVEGMLNFVHGCSDCRIELPFVDGRFYTACSRSRASAQPLFLICIDARNRSNGTVRAQIVRQHTDSSVDAPLSLVATETRDRDEFVLSVTYGNTRGECIFEKLLVKNRDGRASSVSLCSWLLGTNDALVVEYLILKRNLLLFCKSGDPGRCEYYYCLCDERGRELGARRVQFTELSPMEILAADDGTIYVKTELTLLPDNPVDCVHAFYTQARHPECSETPNWFFDGGNGEI